MNINLYDVIIDYIENDKRKYNISYKDTIEYIEEIVKELKETYKD